MTWGLCQLWDSFCCMLRIGVHPEISDSKSHGISWQPCFLGEVKKQINQNISTSCRRWENLGKAPSVNEELRREPSLCSSSGCFKADLILWGNESEGVEFVWVAIKKFPLSKESRVWQVGSWYFLFPSYTRTALLPEVVEWIISPFNGASASS